MPCSLEPIDASPCSREYKAFRHRYEDFLGAGTSLFGVDASPLGEDAPIGTRPFDARPLDTSVRPRAITFWFDVDVDGRRSVIGPPSEGVQGPTPSIKRALTESRIGPPY